MTTRTFSSGYQPSLNDLKANLRITSSDLDVVLEADLKSAIVAAEHHVGRKIGMSVFTLTTDFSGSLKLEGPVASITSVTLDGVVLDPSAYTLRRNTLTFAAGVAGTSVIVVYSAGMSYVPEDIKAAILLHAGQLFNDPVDSVEALPKASTNLLRPYRRWGIDGD